MSLTQNAVPSDAVLIREAQIGYYACITHLDHQIGRLIQALVEYGVYDNTLILFTSDHGEELCDHHMFQKIQTVSGQHPYSYELCQETINFFQV